MPWRQQVASHKGNTKRSLPLAVPAGITTAGFIQVAGGGLPYYGFGLNTLTHTLTGLSVGTNYAVSYLENARDLNTSPFTVQVLVGGVNAVQPHNDSVVGATDPFRTETGMFQATSSSEVFEFLVIDGGNDSMALLTDVSVTEAPEPQAIALFGVGLVSLALGKRKSAKFGRPTTQ